MSADRPQGAPVLSLAVNQPVAVAMPVISGLLLVDYEKPGGNESLTCSRLG